MDNHQSAASNTFQFQTQQQQPSIETLLFNDIIQEKGLILHNLMDQFLRVHSYKKFDDEFNSFIRRLKSITREGQRNGTHLARHIPTTQLTMDNNSPLPGQLPEDGESQENITHSSETESMFQRPVAAEYLPSTKLSHINQLSDIPCAINNLCDTIIEESLNDNDNSQTNIQQQEFLPPTPLIPYSGSSQIDNASPTTLHQFYNGNDDVNAKESNPELAESDEAPNNSDNPSTSLLSQDQLNSTKKSEVHYLTKWAVKINQVKSKPAISLTGTLLAEDKITVLEKLHKAGILVVRKTRNIVKTGNGLYHLIGPISEGSPDNLYRACVEINGMPRRNVLKRLSTEFEINLNESITRNGKIYNNNKLDSPSSNTSKKKAILGNNSLNESNFHQQLSELSTAKNIKPLIGACHTPSALLKYKFHKKFVEACKLSKKKTKKKSEDQ